MGGRFPGLAHARFLLGHHPRWGGSARRRCRASAGGTRLFYSPNGAREANRTYAQKMAAVDDARSFAPEFFGLTPGGPR
jgi:acyl transferase domain-containing protein